MKEVTVEILKQLCPKRELYKLENFINSHKEYGHLLQLNTYSRNLFFFPQIAHETGCFRAIVEDADGKAYEGRIKNLGNTEKGDGPMFKGRGYIMLTGRYNYTMFQKFLDKHFPEKKYDVIKNPDSVGKDLTLAYLTIVFYWNDKKLNRFADNFEKNSQQDKEYKSLTSAINGGQIGQVDRDLKLTTFKRIYNE